MALLLLAGFGFTQWAMTRLLTRFGTRLGLQGASDVAAFPMLLAVLSVFALLATPIVNTIIRTQEVEADRFGLNLAREPQAQRRWTWKLTEYRKPDPTPLEELIFFDHPSTRYRVHDAMRWRQAMDAVADGLASCACRCRRGDAVQSAKRVSSSPAQRRVGQQAVAHRRPARPLTQTPCTPTASVVRRAAPPGRSWTRRFGPRPTVFGSNSSRSAAKPSRIRPRSRKPNTLAGCEVRRRTASASAHRAAVARPVAEQVQAEAGVVEEGEVGAGVAQADDAVRVVEHAADRRPRRC